MAAPQKANVVVADAEPVARLGLIHLINSHARLQVCAEAETVAEAREVCAKWQPDLLVLDPGLSAGEGFALIKDLPRWDADARVVAFTSLDDAISIQRAFKAGARAYVTRRDPIETLIAALNGALDGFRYVGPRLQSMLLEHLACGSVELRGPMEAVLSNRELQVYRMLGEGRSTRVVAVELHLSVKTVETH